MGEMIQIRPRQRAGEHPDLAEISRALNTLNELRDRFGRYDEALDKHLRAVDLRFIEIFGDDDWLEKRPDHAAFR